MATINPVQPGGYHHEDVQHVAACPWHGAQNHVVGHPAPPEITVQTWNRGTIPGLVAKLFAGQTINDAIEWAQQELEGFRR